MSDKPIVPKTAQGTKLTRKDFKDAVTNSFGIKRVIAERLNVHYSTVVNAIEKDEYMRELIKEEEERTKDLVESKLYKKISSDDFNAIKFYLTTRAKDRGFVERQEVEHSGGITSINLNVVKHYDGNTPNPETKPSP